MAKQSTSEGRLPAWLRGPSPLAQETLAVRDVLGRHGLETVCQKAACPNLGRCFAEGTAAFLILGRHCTRHCGFCAIGHGEPAPVDPTEPLRLAAAAKALGLRHVVITSVTRDDLADGGADQFAAAIRAVHASVLGATVEVLTPDFLGAHGAAAKVLEARPEIFNHNLETVPRLYPLARPQADYWRSLTLLAFAREKEPDILTKSGLMLGLGESEEEVLHALEDLRAAGCDMLTLGQYLRPSRRHLPVAEYIPPARFEAWAGKARAMGFKHVAAGPLVRSSFHAAAGLHAVIGRDT